MSYNINKETIAVEETESISVQEETGKENKDEQNIPVVGGEVGELKKKSSFKILILIAIIVIVGIVIFFATADGRTYSKAMTLKENGMYQEAMDMFAELDDYKDSVAQREECYVAFTYECGVELMNTGSYLEASNSFAEILNADYKDTKELHNECIYQLGKEGIDKNDYVSASSYFSELMEINYKDSKELYCMCQYEIGTQYLADKDFDNAIKYLKDLDYRDSQELVENLENGEHSLNAFIKRYNKMADIIENEVGVTIDKISLSDVDESTQTITTSIGAEIKLNEFTDDEKNFKYEINSFLWSKRAWVFVDENLLTADMCCVASGLLPDSSYKEIIGKLAQLAEKSEGLYGSIELDGYRYVMALTKAQTDFSMTPLD